MAHVPPELMAQLAEMNRQAGLTLDRATRNKQALDTFTALLNDWFAATEICADKLARMDAILHE